MKAAAPGNGTGVVVVSVEGRGHAVDKTALFLGRLQIAESNGPALKYEGPLPRGENTLWCRVIFDANHSVDSEPTVLAVTGKPVDPDWTMESGQAADLVPNPADWSAPPADPNNPAAG